MKYENITKAKEVVSKIARLLGHLELIQKADNVKIQISSGETYLVNQFVSPTQQDAAKEFIDFIRHDIERQIDELKAELDTL